MKQECKIGGGENENIFLEIIQNIMAHIFLYYWHFVHVLFNFLMNNRSNINSICHVIRSVVIDLSDQKLISLI